MCYEWKFKAMNKCSMKVQRIHEQMWGEQQSMTEIVQKLKHNSIYFLNLEKFSIVEAFYFLDLEYF